MPMHEYALTDTEKVSLQKFLTEHQSYCPRIKRNSSYSLCFSKEGGIGVGVDVVCTTCGKKHDITDYNTW